MLNDQVEHLFVIPQQVNRQTRCLQNRKMCEQHDGIVLQTSLG